MRGIGSRFFAVETARRAAKLHLVLVDGADFDHGAFRRQIAEQGGQTATL